MTPALALAWRLPKGSAGCTRTARPLAGYPTLVVYVGEPARCAGLRHRLFRVADAPYRDRPSRAGKRVDREPVVGLSSSGRDRAGRHTARTACEEETTVSSRRSSEPVEAYLMEPGEGRPSFDPGVLEIFLRCAAAGGRRRSSPAEEQHRRYSGTGVRLGGTVSPFRVVEREHLYFRGDAETRDPTQPEPGALPEDPDPGATHHCRGVLRRARAGVRADNGPGG